MKGWVLGLETSVPTASVGLFQDGEKVAGVKFVSERTQEADLFGHLQEVLDAVPRGRRLERVLVGTGPGSYNGSRVGIAAAQAVSQVHECELVGLCSFLGVPALVSGGWAVGDARRGSYFMMRVPAVGDERVLIPEFFEHDEFLSQLDGLRGSLVTFDPVERLKLPEKAASQVSRQFSEARVLVDRARHITGKTSKDVIAFYLRPPHITQSTKPAAF